MPFTASIEQQYEEARVEAIAAQYEAQRARDMARMEEQKARALNRYARKLAEKFGLTDLDVTLRLWTK